MKDIQKITLWFQSRRFNRLEDEKNCLSEPFDDSEIKYFEGNYHNFHKSNNDFQASYDRIVRDKEEYITNLYVGPDISVKDEVREKINVVETTDRELQQQKMQAEENIGEKENPQPTVKLNQESTSESAEETFLSEAKPNERKPAVANLIALSVTNTNKSGQGREKSLKDNEADNQTVDDCEELAESDDDTEVEVNVSVQ